MIKLHGRKKPIEIEINEIGCELVINRALSKFGHVSIRVNGVYYKAHRIAYEQAYGKIPEGLIVRHMCDNPNCINPEHLELGTHEDNVSDRVKRNRSAIGVGNGRSKLTENDVRNIRNDTIHSKAELARKYNVSEKVIYNIKNYKSWKHVI